MSIAEKFGGRLVYIATATPGDDEMRERIENHKRSRGMNWNTIEETLDLSGAVTSLGGEGTVVIDCLTLWLTNLMMQDMEAFEDVAAKKARELADALHTFKGTAIVVSNEVGLGIVPENALSRRFRDVAGTANKIIASAADEVYLVVSGIPVKIK
jgi:adenosylcobinamide kinase/adenosylcobinamide-phosphate guanylyltransferase